MLRSNNNKAQLVGKDTSLITYVEDCLWSISVYVLFMYNLRF